MRCFSNMCFSSVVVPRSTQLARNTELLFIPRYFACSESKFTQIIIRSHHDGLHSEFLFAKLNTVVIQQRGLDEQEYVKRQLKNGWRLFFMNGRSLCLFLQHVLMAIHHLILPSSLITPLAVSRARARARAIARASARTIFRLKQEVHHLIHSVSL